MRIYGNLLVVEPKKRDIIALITLIYAGIMQ